MKGRREKSLSSRKSHYIGASYVMVMEHMAWKINYCIMKEGMPILRGWKSVPGMNSSGRKMERGYYSAFMCFKNDENTDGGKQKKNDMGACIEKLDKVRWAAQDPMYDTDDHLVNNPTPLEAKDHFVIVTKSNDDISSSDDDSLYNENIEYVEASPHDSKLVSLEAAEIVILDVEEIEDDNLREKLLNPKIENFCFDLEEISSDSTTTDSDISLSDYEFFYFDDDHIEEISGGSTTTHSDISLSEYDSFIFDLSNDQFPPSDRSDLTNKEFADELAHIISPPEYDCFYFRNLPDPGK
nr:hypothetical protein [Tanacetum cinerariifolium]